MRNEPDNRKIEELMKPYARKRGEQSGGKFDVHPAVRKMLQGEVSRQYPPAQPETKGWLKWVLLFWPRLAFGAAAVALLSAVLWNVSQNPNPSERDMKLAKADKEPAKRQNAPVEGFGEPQ